MTWNLWWRFGDWKRRHDPISRILDAAAPDIAGLQEVWGGLTANQAHILAETLGMHHAWCPSPAPEHFQRRTGDRTVVVGNAILSRWPITRKSVRELPAGAGDAGRTALFALIDAPFGAVPVCTTQFSSGVGRSELRCKQVRALTEFIAEETRDCANSILTGDLNAEGETRKVDGEFVKDYLEGDLDQYTFLVAGPPAMAEGVQGALQEADVRDENVIVERYSGY
jgi:endonuclease/exonuclease/phosphatase family metal-dependent hydrolase